MRAGKKDEHTDARPVAHGSIIPSKGRGEGWHGALPKGLRSLPGTAELLLLEVVVVFVFFFFFFFFSDGVFAVDEAISHSF
jgi:hypothetical protein